MFVRVARLEELPPDGKPVIRLVGIFPVALARVRDKVVAFQAFCPHSRWNLGASGLCFVDRHGDVKVVCTGHGGVWSLGTGEGQVQGREAPRLATYAVKVVDGEVYVDLETARQPAGTYTLI